MHGTNPYAQAGWYNPQNPHTLNNQPWGTSVAAGPSIFGALPYPSKASLPLRLTFHYVLLDPDVLRCMITGPTSIPYLEVATIPSKTHISTVFRKNDGRILASIEWGNCPTVEVVGCLPKQLISNWLRLSPDKGHRAMTTNGKEYMWIPRSDCICLFSYGGLTGEPLVKISRGHKAVTLELTTEAFAVGLLEAAIVATVLLQSGRNID